MKKPAVLISHPTGNQNLRNALLSLVENGMLAEFWTTVAWDRESVWNRLLPSGLRSQLARRSFPDTPKDRIHCVPLRETIRLTAKPLHLESMLCSAERPFSVIGMYRNFDARVAARLRTARVDAVYAYEGGALNTFREARQLGIAAIYELPSSHWYWEQTLLLEEAERSPQFSGLLPKLKDSPRHMQWKDEELRLADCVIVPSEHVRRTLSGVVPAEKIRVVNYGAPFVEAIRSRSDDPAEPLRVLFVGALIQRKGIGYLLDAIDMVGTQVTLTLVGMRFAPNTRVDSACNRWRWFESLSHSEILEVMQEADVLVLPSLAEGCALVVLEALACGLPVIVTPNTGSLEFVRDGYEGFVVPTCNSEAIAERLNRLCRDRDLLASMSQYARQTAIEKSWEVYRNEWAEAVRGAICQ
jgi:glycosyltransferase involved in cell wall biosynthesis